MNNQEVIVKLKQLKEYMVKTEQWENIFPITFVQAIYEQHSGKRLDTILRSINSVFLTYGGTFENTVIEVSDVFRRNGFIITYQDINGVNWSKRYTKSNYTDEAWCDISNWEGWDFNQVIDDVNKLVLDIFNNIEKYPDIIKYILIGTDTSVTNIFNNIEEYNKLYNLIKTSVTEIVTNIFNNINNYIELKQLIEESINNETVKRSDYIFNNINNYTSTKDLISNKTIEQVNYIFNNIEEYPKIKEIIDDYIVQRENIFVIKLNSDTTQYPNKYKITNLNELNNNIAKYIKDDVVNFSNNYLFEFYIDNIIKERHILETVITKASDNINYNLNACGKILNSFNTNYLINIQFFNLNNVCTIFNKYKDFRDAIIIIKHNVDNKTANIEQGFLTEDFITNLQIKTSAITKCIIKNSDNKEIAFTTCEIIKKNNIPLIHYIVKYHDPIIGNIISNLYAGPYNQILNITRIDNTINDINLVNDDYNLGLQITDNYINKIIKIPNASNNYYCNGLMSIKDKQKLNRSISNNIHIIDKIYNKSILPNWLQKNQTVLFNRNIWFLPYITIKLNTKNFIPHTDIPKNISFISELYDINKKLYPTNKNYSINFNIHKENNIPKYCKAWTFTFDFDYPIDSDKNINMYANDHINYYYTLNGTDFIRHYTNKNVDNISYITLIKGTTKIKIETDIHEFPTPFNNIYIAFNIYNSFDYHIPLYSKNYIFTNISNIENYNTYAKLSNYNYKKIPIRTNLIGTLNSKYIYNIRNNMYIYNRYDFNNFKTNCFIKFINDGVIVQDIKNNIFLKLNIPINNYAILFRKKCTITCKYIRDGNIKHISTPINKYASIKNLTPLFQYIYDYNNKIDNINNICYNQLYKHCINIESGNNRVLRYIDIAFAPITKNNNNKKTKIDRINIIKYRLYFVKNYTEIRIIKQ